ncbi:EF-hand domain-containing protein [Oxalobacteraceae bacterium OTU3REALA1]|nr:EF-hand domain-containing protein [Oxalobacteraceae bacterium OTU3REALA1]
MNLLHPTLLTALLATAGAGAQTPQAETPASAAGMSTPYSDSYVPRSMRQPQRDIAPGPVLLRFTSVQKLKKRFEDADTDRSGTLNREEARQAGLGVVDKNFDSIDTAQRGNVSFDDLNAYLIQRREESGSR